MLYFLITGLCVLIIMLRYAVHQESQKLEEVRADLALINQRCADISKMLKSEGDLYEP